jgi:hypothetical protein
MFTMMVVIQISQQVKKFQPAGNFIRGWMLNQGTCLATNTPVHMKLINLGKYIIHVLEFSSLEKEGYF